MLKIVFVLNALFVLCVASQFCRVNVVNPGPKHPPTSGEVWPKPQQEKKHRMHLSLVASELNLTITKYTCNMLTNAVIRFSRTFRSLIKITNKTRCSNRRRKRNDGTDRHRPMTDLRIELLRPCEKYPYFRMDESYNITVSTVSTISSNSIWGLMHGLETTSQLFFVSKDGCDILVSSNDIIDYPLYAHRGLLLDTARHYISVSQIYRTLDAMAMNKMNVFHWHIVDDQSFPYESKAFPELSYQAAYSKCMIYTADDILSIIDYARTRGIRVIPEFDVPGHTRSWGESHPEILTECYENESKLIGLGPLNPLKNETYDLMGKLFTEVMSLFTDQFFHIGGDEIDFPCWESNPDIRKHTEQNNCNRKSLLQKFLNKTFAILKNRTAIVWQEVIEEKVRLPEKTLVQIWKTYWINDLSWLVIKKQRTILSSPWYLDDMTKTFERLYIQDPRSTLKRGVPAQRLSYLVGGEACMWSETVDDTNIISRLWPRTCAVAEVLWRGNELEGPTEDTMRRIEEHTCRMRRRGVQAEPPAGPGFCQLE